MVHAVNHIRTLLVSSILRKHTHRKISKDIYWKHHPLDTLEEYEDDDTMSSFCSFSLSANFRNRLLLTQESENTEQSKHGIFSCPLDGGGGGGGRLVGGGGRLVGGGGRLVEGGGRLVGGGGRLVGGGGRHRGGGGRCQVSAVLNHFVIGHTTQLEEILCFLCI